MISYKQISNIKANKASNNHVIVMFLEVWYDCFDSTEYIPKGID